MNRSIYYTDNTDERVQENDIVRICKGVNKNDLALVVEVDRPAYKVTVMSIRNGSKLILSVSSVSFCYHNTKAATKAWLKQMKYNTKKFVEKYTDIKYIVDNWFNDYWVKNSVTGETLMKAVGCVVDKPLEWLIYWEQAIELSIVYRDYTFVRIYCNRLEKRHYSDYILDKLFHVLIPDKNDY